MKRLFAVLPALVLLCGSSWSQAQERGAPASRIAGNWQVSYEDLALGEVDGTATIAADGKHADVQLRAGPQGASYKLVAESIAESGDDYTLVLTGEGPSAASLKPDATVERQAARAAQQATATVLAGYGVAAPPAISVPMAPMAPHLVPAPTLGNKVGWAFGQPTQPPDVHLKVPGDANSIRIEVADFTGTLPFQPMDPVQTRRVVLTLHYRPTMGLAGYSGPAGDLLSGTWKYYADPITWRDGEGKGRVGNFRRDPDNPNRVTQSGAEVWFRPNPPAQLQFIAIGVYGEIRIKHLFPGVPTIVEAIFDAPQDDDTIAIEVEVGGVKVPMSAHRDPENGRRFTTDPFLPGPDGRPAPAPSAPPSSTAESDTATEGGP